MKLLLIAFLFIPNAVLAKADSTTFKRLKENTAKVVTITGHGSGAFLTRTILLTNDHVCDSIPMHVIDYRGKKHKVAKFILSSKQEIDLCLIRTYTGPKIDRLPIARKGTSSIGERVYYAGYPLDFFVTRSGILFEEVMLGDRTNKNFMYVINIPADFGESGSPVLNSKGRLIGVVFAKLHDDEADRHYTGVMPLEFIRPFVRGALKMLHGAK